MESWIWAFRIAFGIMAVLIMWGIFSVAIFFGIMIQEKIEDIKREKRNNNELL